MSLKHGETPPASRSARLRVVTYNVQFLPTIARIANLRSRAWYRGRAIGRRLRKFDIIGLNEAFETGPRRALLRRLQQAWRGRFHARVSQRPRSGRFSSGLVIVSRLPIVASDQMKFSRGSSVWRYGILADSFAAKGALHARVAWEADRDRQLDVFVTHLDSRDVKVRAHQVRELAMFVRRHSSPERPTLVMGDFNVAGQHDMGASSAAEYGHMMSVLAKPRREGPLLDLAAELNQHRTSTLLAPWDTDGGRRIDYILTVSPEDAMSRLQPTATAVNPHRDRRVGTLSDHAAVEAELLWHTS